MWTSIGRSSRSYATSSTPTRLTAKAQAASAPTQVRIRREQLLQGVDAAVKDGHADPLPVSARTALRRPPVEKESRRGRVRGVRVVKGRDGEKVEKIVGERVYLPNIVVRMIRNNTPSGKAYNPYEATFRVPQYLTKTDIRSYLLTVYGVETTYIRTDNYFPEELNARRLKAQRGQVTSQSSAYKRAVVGLVKPFYYPQAVEDMNGRDRWLREAYLEENFQIQEQEQTQRYILARATQKSSDDWKMRNEKWGTRSSILKEVWRRREEREARIREAAQILSKVREGEAEGESSS